jgi:hypothetical protein
VAPSVSGVPLEEADREDAEESALSEEDNSSAASLWGMRGGRPPGRSASPTDRALLEEEDGAGGLTSTAFPVAPAIALEAPAFILARRSVFPLRPVRVSLTLSASEKSTS